VLLLAEEEAKRQTTKEVFAWLSMNLLRIRAF
jgi:hypothetical protein